jgi:hypothetical protein
MLLLILFLLNKYIRYTLVATLPSEKRGVSSLESLKTEISLNISQLKQVYDVHLTPVSTSTLQASQVRVFCSKLSPIHSTAQFYF